MGRPEIGYVRTDRGAIAVHRSGAGDRTIIYTSTPLVSIETKFDNPAVLRMREFLDSLGQVVAFDFLGFGISDQLSLDRVAQLDEMAADINAIVDACSPSLPILVATVGSTMPAIMFLAENPGAVERAVLLNPSARSVDVAEAPEERARKWGTGAFLLGAVKPELLSEAQRRQAGRAERIGASPRVAETWHARRHDVSGLLAAVRTPTLVVNTGDIPLINPEMSNEVAAGIPGATYLAGQSTLFSWGDWESEVRAFITGGSQQATGWRDLASVLFSDVVGSTEHAARIGDGKWKELLGCLDSFVEREALKHQGRVVKQTGDGHLLEFPRPGDAVAAAEAIVVGASSLGVEMRVGVHYGEVERRPTGDLGGIGVHIAARVASLANEREVLVSRTVTEVTAGSGHSYINRGTHHLRGVPGEWPLFGLEIEETPRTLPT